MVQGYYTLEESANILGMSPDELKQLARKGEVRSFQDRGTWRFRIQDIQEMARRSSQGSDLEAGIGDSLQPTATDSPAPRSPKPQKKDDDVFNFSLATEPEEEVNVNLGSPSKIEKSHVSSGGKKASSGKLLVTPGSDSDVRLVTEGKAGGIKAPSDSDVRLSGEEGPKSGPRSSKTGLAGSKSPKPAKSKPALTPPPQKTDSGVRLVGLDSDSDVRIADADDSKVRLADEPAKSATDSDIRLEGPLALAPAGEAEGQLTEEINLDEELEKQEARQRERGGSKPRHAEPPKKSPFDLSQSELVLAPPDEPEPLPISDEEGSSDFELTPASESSSPLELSGSDELRLEVPDEDALTLADEGPTDLKAPQSGINLGHPADSGISLEEPEQGSEDVEYELTLDAESPPRSTTPKPKSGRLVAPEESGSEFELSLDADSEGQTDSDSEFDLTLDDAGDAAVGGEETAGQEQEKDIFETDFDVPGLEDESGSEAVAVEDAESDLASSDFDLDISEEEALVEDESGSEVMAVDEELLVEEEEETRPKTKRGKKKAALDDEELADLEGEDDVVVEEEEPALAAAPVPTAPWGVLPVAVLLPCVVVMVLLGLMGFELVQSQQGYKPGFLTRSISGLIDGKK